jgi:hypothetical protein
LALGFGESSKFPAETNANFAVSGATAGHCDVPPVRGGGGLERGGRFGAGRGAAGGGGTERPGGGLGGGGGTERVDEGREAAGMTSVDVPVSIDFLLSRCASNTPVSMSLSEYVWARPGSR